MNNNNDPIPVDPPEMITVEIEAKYARILSNYVQTMHKGADEHAMLGTATDGLIIQAALVLLWQQMTFQSDPLMALVHELTAKMNPGHDIELAFRIALNDRPEHIPLEMWEGMKQEVFEEDQFKDIDPLK